MVEPSIGERADELSRRRARVLPFLAIIYLTQQATFFSTAHADSARHVDTVKISAWLVLSAVLLAALASKGFWLERKAVRDLIDDESTRANRSEAMRFGFVAGMLAAIIVYFLTMIEPVTAREAIHIILSAGIGAALLRLGFLERRAHRGG